MERSVGRQRGSARVKTGPVRTCVGCRMRATVSELLRVVAVGGVLVPDPRRRMSGRGASLHPDVTCFDLAVRRRAFTRALRVVGELDQAAARDFVERMAGAVRQDSSAERNTARQQHSTSGHRPADHSRRE